ncbi:MAG: hypothetical protein AAGU19_19185 [Prolixibacteraceae bacterium]
MDKPNEKEELTMQNVPKAVNYLINEVAEMRVLLGHIESHLGHEYSDSLSGVLG